MSSICMIYSMILEFLSFGAQFSQRAICRSFRDIENKKNNISNVQSGILCATYIQWDKPRWQKPTMSEKTARHCLKKKKSFATKMNYSKDIINVMVLLENRWSAVHITQHILHICVCEWEFFFSSVKFFCTLLFFWFYSVYFAFLSVCFALFFSSIVHLAEMVDANWICVRKFANKLDKSQDFNIDTFH